MKSFFALTLPGASQITVGDYLFHLLLAVVITYFMIYVIKTSLHQFFKRTNFLEEKKEQTIESVFDNSSQYIATFIILFAAIQPLFDLKQLLVAGGVLGIVIGFGAQALISDIFTGIFLVFEKQFQKGDFVHINGENEGGTVEEIGLRVVKIRMLSGKLMFVPNGQIKKVVNGNIEVRRVFESIVVSFREDPAKIKALLEEVCEELNEKHQDSLMKDEEGLPVEAYRYQGLSSLDASPYGFKYTIVATLIDTEYIAAVREAKQLLAEKLYAAHIKMPEQQMYFELPTTKVAGF